MVALIPDIPLLSALRARLSSLVRGVRQRSAVEAEMDEEFRHHIELHAERLISGGLSPRAAYRQARLDFGHIESHKETARASRGLSFFDEIRFSWLDLKLGLRMLKRNPGLTLAALFALGVGIPVGMAPMHFANVMETPLPEDPENRVRGLRYWNTGTMGIEPTTGYELTRWRSELTSFEKLAATRTDIYNVDTSAFGPGELEPAQGAPLLGAELTASSFEILEARPHLGRTFVAADEASGAARVVLVGYDFWQSRLGGDKNAIGRTLSVGEVPHTVVGVMRKDFQFPIRQQLWLPLHDKVMDAPGEGLELKIFGRLAEGVNSEVAQVEMTAIGQRLAQQFPETHKRLEPEVVPFQMSFLGLPRGGLASEPGFYFFQLLGFVLLLVACANVAMLIFARTATRSEELAVRTALGASRTRILSQMFAESLVISLLAAALGLAAAALLLARIFDFALSIDTVLPYWLEVGVTPRAVGLAFSLAVVSAVIAGVAPGLKVTRAQVHQNIQQARAANVGSRFGGLTTALVVADVAVAITVVGLAMGLANWAVDARSENNLAGVPVDEYLTAEIRLPQRTSLRSQNAAPSEGQGAEAFEARLAAMQRTFVEHLLAEPAVRSVAIASELPRMDHRNRSVEVEGVDTAAELPHSIRLARVDLDFFDAFGHPVLRGRPFDWADTLDHSAAVIVNTDFVDRLLGGGQAIGQRVRFVPRGPADESDKSQWYEIVGVVGSLGMNAISTDGDAGIYLAAAPGTIHPLRLAIHTDGDPGAFTPRLRELLLEAEPTAVLSRARTLDQVVQGDWYLMIGVAGGLVLLLVVLIALASSGIFAMTSFIVSQRTSEIGIRTALGASRFAVVTMVFRRSLIQLAVGALIGTPLAFFALRESFETTAAGLAVALLTAAGVMALIGVIACTAPALRALRIEPQEALRGAD